MNNTIVYIDGFNLYFGLKSKQWKRFYWLDLVKLAQNILKPNQYLIKVKYYTAKVSVPADKAKRQLTFIEALELKDNLIIKYGKYQPNEIKCNVCGNKINKPNEKMTDVNIATDMLTDAFENVYDTAILISADSDLSGPVKYIKNRFSDKRIVLAFPPGRFSYDLSQIADAHFTIGRKKFKDSLLPEEIQKPNGFILRKPHQWK